MSHRSTANSREFQQQRTALWSKEKGYQCYITKQFHEHQHANILCFVLHCHCDLRVDEEHYGASLFHHRNNGNAMVILTMPPRNEDIANLQLIMARSNDIFA